MTKELRNPLNPWDSLGERLLASTAIKIELLPSQLALMAQRKRAIENHLQRDDSPLKDLIRIFYQQGSVAIGSTIKNLFRDDGIDIDIIVELLLNGISPAAALDLLYRALKGEPGSRYFDCTQRQSRCVTIHYADGMHIDLSPSVLLDEADPRRSHIFHSKPEDPRSADYCVLTNSYAFAEHYNERCPIDRPFAEEYGRRVRVHDVNLAALMKDAETVPVPAHSTVVGGKSAVTVALQLLKRNRDIRWRPRSGRMPASAMFACLTVEVAAPGRSIGQNLRITAEHILHRLVSAKLEGKLVEVQNPRCAGDIFTDRWPANSQQQDALIGDMRLFIRQLDVLLDEDRPFAERAKVLEEMFGEKVARSVIDEFADELGGMIRGASHFLGATGGVLASPAAARPQSSFRPNTFYADTNLVRVEPRPSGRSLASQIDSMKRLWPMFDATRGLSPGSVVWFGQLKGLERSFFISVEYGVPMPEDQSLFRFFPVIRVLRPALKLNWNASEEAPLPHVYFERPDVRLSPLCLFDPGAGEWNPGMSIADTTLPWAARWLACYEIWEATGRWVGGGRHAESANAA